MNDLTRMNHGRSMPHLSTTTIDYALVVGAGHGIGCAISSQLLAENPSLTLFCTFRDEKKAKPLFDLKEPYPERLVTFKVDPTSENQVSDLAASLFSHTSYLDGLINCVGMLHSESIQPEKSLRYIELDHLMKIFTVNSFVTPLLGKAFLKFFRNKRPSFFTTISAKVGSIEDNKSGGWYSYRASKAALNMFLKNIALEMQMLRTNTLVLSLHPGTTATELSQPYISRTKYKLHQPEETARNLIKVINQCEISDNGSFFSWDGSRLPW